MKYQSIIWTALILLLVVKVTFARDPDLPPPDYGYDERETVGGGRWTSGDMFIAIALPIAVVLTLALPHVFDGESISPPMWWQRNDIVRLSDVSIPWRIESSGQCRGHQNRPLRYKFPTRSR